jgi:Tol biopolymer transport system component
LPLRARPRLEPLEDRTLPAVSLVSMSTSGVIGNSYSNEPSISADGRYVAFHSNANNLASNDLSGNMDVFVRDLQTDTTTLVSVSTNGGSSNNSSYQPSISADGRYVAFYSHASNLVASDANGTRADVFVRDLVNNTTTGQ